MTTEQISPEKYEKLFKDKEEKALEHALDIRKFEIDLYWKRATYFWTFISVTMAGFLAVQASTVETKQDLSIILACLGIVFSFAWFCVNKGSKYWQENWEKHVDVLEDSVTGPLYKVVLSRNKDMSVKEKGIDIITGAANISVSKVNQIISLYVTILWIALLLYALPKFDFSETINWFYTLIIGLSFAACVSFLVIARSYGGGYYHIATLRKSRVKPSETTES